MTAAYGVLRERADELGFDVNVEQVSACRYFYRIYDGDTGEPVIVAQTRREAEAFFAGFAWQNCRERRECNGGLDTELHRVLTRGVVDE